jgi:Ni/Co efflux regulator RcnB
MNTTKSFTGLNVYEVTEIAEVEYINVSKNWFTKKQKVTRIKLDDANHKVIIIAVSPDVAIEKYKDRYKCWKVGEDIHGSIGLTQYRNSTIVGVKFYAKGKRLTAQELFEKASVDDYVKYVNNSPLKF